MTKFFGLLHTPRAEIVIVRTEKEINGIFDQFNIFLNPHNMYLIYHKKEENYSRELVLLVREEFELVPLTDEQVREMNAKMDSIRDQGTDRKRTTTKRV